MLTGKKAFGTLVGIGLLVLVTTRGKDDIRTLLNAKPQRHANGLLVPRGVKVLRSGAPAFPDVSDHRLLILEIDRN